MTSSKPNDDAKDTNEEKEEENEPKRSFRAEYARKSHNNTERKRKDKISLWINKIYELLPNDPKKESKNGILERAYHYMVHLKEMNDKLIYGNAAQIIGEELRFARKRISKLEETNAVYYKTLKMSGITPSNIPLDAMKPLTAKNTKIRQTKKIPDKSNQSAIDLDAQSDVESDTTEVIEDLFDDCKNIGDQNLKKIPPMNEQINLDPLVSKTPLLVVNQNQDHNAPRISLSNGSQLQIRPSPNVQILGNGALAIDSSGFNQGQIILGSTLLSPPQPTTLLMSNGQLLSLVNQPQPAFVYTPGAGFVLTSSTPINSSVNVPIKTTEQPEKGKKKTRVTVNNEPEATIASTETIEKVVRPKRCRTFQKTSSNKAPVVEVSPGNDQYNEQQNVRSTPILRSAKRPRNVRVNQKVKETSDKLITNEANLQSDESITKEKRPRPTTVIERVTDTPDKECSTEKSTNKSISSTKGSTEEFAQALENGSTNKNTCDDLTNSDLGPENRIGYSYRQNGDDNEAACDQDQLPLLLGSLSDDNEMSTESVHSVSNSSLPTFLSLSPSDHLTDFLSKTSEQAPTTRSPRYASPINQINTNGSASQTPSVIMSNQGTNLISESSNCHPGHHLVRQNEKDLFEADKNLESEIRGKDTNVPMCVDESYSNPINQHHHHHHLMMNEREPIESSNHTSNNDAADPGQTRLYSTETQENRRSETDKSTNSQSELGMRKSSEARNLSSTSTTAPTITSTTSLSSNVNAPVSSANNSATSQERNFLPYSAESLLRQPQSNMPTAVPINSIYHVHSNVTVDPNIDFGNRGSGSASTTNVSSNARPTISYSAERLIHSPSIENSVSANQSSRLKSHEANKVAPITTENHTAAPSTNIYNEQYSAIRTTRGNDEMDSNLSRIQSNHHQHHSQQQQTQQPQQQHSSNVYRTSPQNQDQRSSQDQHQSSRNSNQQTQSQQQIIHQQRNVYSDNQHHHQHHQPQSGPPQQLSRNQAQSNAITMKTTSTSDSTSTNNSGNNNSGNSSTNNANANNAREIFNHSYPYGSMPNDGATTAERISSHANFNNNTGNPQNDGFIENNSHNNNFIPPFASNNNCQPPFNSSNNRRSSSTSTAMLAPFPFSDPLSSSTSFSSDPYNRQVHTSSSSSSANTNHSANFDTNRRNSGHFADHPSSSASNNSTNNYFMMHNHHAASSSLSNSNNPPIFSTGSSFPGLIPSSNYDNNGYNLTCPPRPSSTINPSGNSASTSANSNLHSHHHPVFYTDSTLPMHNSRRQSEASLYSASTKSVNNGNSSSSKSPGNSTTSTTTSKSGKSTGSSSKSTKKGSTANGTKSRNQSSNDSRISINNPAVVNSYPSMAGFAPPPPPTSSSSATINHRSVVTPSSSALNAPSSERSIDSGDSLFRPQPQSNSTNNMQSSSSRTSAPSSHSLPPVGHSSTFLPNFSFNIFPEIGSINPNENFAMSGLSAIKFNHPNHVLPHHPNPNAPFTHSSALQGTGPMDNSSSSMGDNSSHQNIYGHHGRIATPHHHNHVSFIPLIGTSPRTLK